MKMLSSIKKLPVLVAAIGAAAAMSLSGCDERNDASGAAEDAVEDAGDAIEDAGDKTEDAAEKAADRTEDALDDAADRNRSLTNNVGEGLRKSDLDPDRP